MKKLISFLLCFVCVFTCMSQKPADYKYRRELNGIKDVWHKIILPEDIFSRLSPELNDIRIFRIGGSDTTEAPYIITGKESLQQKGPVPFQLINRSATDSGYYITFQMQQATQINTIQLNITTVNYDWRTDLQGSHDQQNWFTLLKDYRIVALQNNQVKFEFDRIVFPTASYKFFRLLIKSKTDPQITGASLLQNDSLRKPMKAYPVVTGEMHDTKNRMTVLTADLPYPVPVSSVRVVVKDSFDYLRQIIIERLTDSFQTEKGWQYNYENFYVGAIRSQSNNEFIFPSAIAQRLRIRIVDGDNAKLQFGSIQVAGPQYALIARFDQRDKYYLYYGNKDLSAPEYDIKHFIEKVPDDAVSIEIGKEALNKVGGDDRNPLFMNKEWLWAILLVIVAILGWFTFKMLRQHSAS